MQGNARLTKEDSIVLNCSFLQYVVNYHSIPDLGSLPQRLNVSFIDQTFKLVCSKVIGVVSFSVFESEYETDAFQFVIFRGYKLGTMLPLPIWGRPKEFHPFLVSTQQFNAWKEAKDAIVSCIDVRKSVILSGYSTGSAYAFFTSVFVPSCSSLVMFSPLPFCERRVFDEMTTIPSFTIIIDGDTITNIYSCILSVDYANLIRIPSYKKFLTTFGYHNSITTFISVLKRVHHGSVFHVLESCVPPIEW